MRNADLQRSTCSFAVRCFSCGRPRPLLNATLPTRRAHAGTQNPPKPVFWGGAKLARHATVCPPLEGEAHGRPALDAERRGMALPSAQGTRDRRRLRRPKLPQRLALNQDRKRDQRPARAAEASVAPATIGTRQSALCVASVGRRTNSATPWPGVHKRAAHVAVRLAARPQRAQGSRHCQRLVGPASAPAAHGPCATRTMPAVNPATRPLVLHRKSTKCAAFCKDPTHEVKG